MALAAPTQYQLFKQGAQTNMMIRRLDYGVPVEKIIGKPKSLQLINFMVVVQRNLPQNCANLQQRNQFQFILIKTSTQPPKPIGVVLHLR